MAQTINFRKGNNLLFLIYLFTCKCKQSSCLHLPYTAALTIETFRVLLGKVCYNNFNLFYKLTNS